ncbi:dystrophin [Nasonia vitripennis]|uniref:ZZ-type domain-containing protein n=1 Tax=Nasonia vitripennis TaxID=7425 RepID=A0A7M7PZT1_NASVI|nr:dystrophin [Nasonia vitripennis]
MAEGTVNNRNKSFNNRSTILDLTSVMSTMEEIMKSINECNTIRYASYRTASKMQVFHKALNMHYVQVELVAGIFERHRLSVTENSVNLDIHEIEDVLSDIYFAAQKENNVNFDVDQSTKLTLNYIFKTFNKKEDDNIPVLSVKVALTLISCGRLEEKYGYLFHQLADHNACLSRVALNTLLTNICKITEMLGENVAYGNHLIRTSIDNCFSVTQGCLGVSEAEFAAWLMQEPPLLMWITTLNRIKSAEQIVHNSKCSSCKTTPIRGPRYSCLKCTGYNQCQTCFLYGKISGKHKLKHPVREYCIKTSSKEITKLLLELIRNKLRLCPTRNENSSLEDSLAGGNLEQTKSFDTMSVRSTIKRRILNDPQKELQSIISHLEEENRQLQLELKEVTGSGVHKLQHHRVAIESQLERLKILKNYLFTQATKGLRDLNLIQSTPMVHPAISRISALPMAFQLSPIIHQNSPDYENSSALDNNDTIANSNSSNKISGEILFSGDSFNATNSTHLEPSTWIGGHRTTFTSHDSGFSQWLNSRESASKARGKTNESENIDVDSSTYSSGISRDNALPSLKHTDKHSEHSSLQNIQGDLNDILDRLQNMVANDCLLEDTFSADNNCELKRAATEMEDLLTGLIEGMESRKGKLTTIV